MLVQASLPVVRVPVLSKKMVPREDRASSDAPVRITMPLQAHGSRSLVDELRCSWAAQAREQTGGVGLVRTGSKHSSQWTPGPYDACAAPICQSREQNAVLHVASQASWPPQHAECSSGQDVQLAKISDALGLHVSVQLSLTTSCGCCVGLAASPGDPSG